MALLDDVRQLLSLASQVYAQDEEARTEIAVLDARMAEPLRVAIAGRVKAGKSTLLNALVGSRLAPTDAGECTKIVTWYKDAVSYRVMLQPTAGAEVQVPFHRDEGAIDIDLGGRAPDDIERLTVEWPSPRLAQMTLIDTPGLGAATVVHSERTEAFLAFDEDGVGQADAVVYLLRHMHGRDMDFLEAFRDDVGSATPVNAIAVLSRADEVGSCRPDALDAARAVSLRYRDDPKLRQLCQQVVPVAGLLAEAAATLTETDFQTLRSLAALDEAVRESMLLSVDRFVGPVDTDITEIERRELLYLMGLFGVRLSLDLIATGEVTTASALSSRLRSESGIGALEATLAGLFSGRRDVLKARVVLAGLDDLARRRGAPAVDNLVAELERVGANAHEFAETHLLSAVRSGALPFGDAEVTEIEQLIGGGEVHMDTTQILESIGRWTVRAESPMATREMSLAARTVVRSYEGLYARTV